MKTLHVVPLLALLTLSAACGGGEPVPPTDAPAAPEAAEPEGAAPPMAGTPAGFDWEKWAAIVNENPCNWLEPRDLADLGIDSPGELENSASGSRCLWKDAEGGQLFSAGVQTWDSAANLAGERASQMGLAADMNGFNLIGDGAGTVTAIYRASRGSLVIFPNSDEETAAIVLNAQKTMGEDDTAKAAKDARAAAFARKLIEIYSL